jgi:hypothetical protein
LNQNDVLDTVMGGLSAEAIGADPSDFPPTHQQERKKKDDGDAYPNEHPLTATD